MEVWRFINDKYRVSNLGRVMNDKYKILSQKTNKCGYKEVSIKIDGKFKTQLVHRLVAKAFIDNPNNKPQVNHINGDKACNRVENLEWITNDDNIKHSIKTGIRDVKKISLITKEKLGKKVRQYDLNNNLLKEWVSIRDIERSLNINRHNIRLVCQGKQQSTHGYIFQYVEG